MSYLLRNADFAQTPLKNAVIERRPSAPAHGVVGQIYFDTTAGITKIYGTDRVWAPLGTGDPGPTGPANTLSVGTVTTLTAGQPATVVITGVAPDQTINFGVPTGPQGSTGATGSQGIQGVKGDTGNQGIQGIKGDTGDTGGQGIQGIQGVKGDTGDTGSIGPAGPPNSLAVGIVSTLPAGSSASATITGAAPNQTLGLGVPRGDTGAQGIQGVKGDTGDTGSQGIQGIQGNQGIQGVKGDTGDTGIQGTPGVDGIGIPIGAPLMWLTGTPPTDFLLLNGQTPLITDYPLLAALWGTTFGGNGTTTFGVPDWREYSPVGASASSPYDVLNAAIGAKTAAGLLAHTHAVDHDHAAFNSGDEAAHVHSLAHDHAAATSGAGSSHNHTFTGGTSGNDNTEHTHSGTSSTVSSGHTHGFTTGNPSANHYHGVGIQSGGRSAAHTHGLASGSYKVGSGSTSTYYYVTDGGATRPLTSGGESADHSHYVSGNTGTVSEWHTHSGTTADINQNHTHTMTTGGRSAYHQHACAGSNAAEAAHTHSVDLPNHTGNTGAGGTHLHAVDVPAFTGASGSAGSGTSFGILDPKRVCHFIVRGR